MKYLVKHTKELIITIGVFLSVLLVILWAAVAVVKGSFSYENVVALIGVIFEMLGWYYNMPTSEENSKYTGKMRMEKDFMKNGTDGENFFDDPVEDGEDS